MRYVYDGTTYVIYEHLKDGDTGSCIAAGKAPAKLAVRWKDKTWYIPAVSTKTKTLLYTSDEDDYSFYCTPVSPTICLKKNGTIYYCGNISREATVSIIPAGTYTPSAFETYIKKYISVNTYRTTSSDFSVKVNNQTITVWSNTAIYYMNNASSGTSSIARAVNFYGSYKEPGSCFQVSVANGTTGFSANKVYIVNGGDIPYFGYYSNYNITVLNDIVFK